MATSDVQICNLALGRAGCQQFIDSLDDLSTEAMYLKRIYDLTLERVLQDFPWQFAKKYAPLSDIGTPVSPWAYRYRYPSDCLQLHRVYPQGGSIVSGQVSIAPVYGQAIDNAYSQGYLSKSAGVPFDTSIDTPHGRAVHCDFPSAYAEYTVRVTNVALYTPAFVNTFAWALASEIFTPLSADPKYAQTAQQAYAKSLAEAGALSFGESQQDRLPDGELLAARNG